MRQFLITALVALGVLQGCAKGNSIDATIINSNLPGMIAADAE